MPHRLSCDGHLSCDGQSSVFTIDDAYRILEAFGPMPAEALIALVDCGLSDAEIARYLDLPHELITTLREHWGIVGNS